MMYIHFNDIDWEYLKERAKEERTQEELNEFKKIAKEKIDD